MNRIESVFNFDESGNAIFKGVTFPDVDTARWAVFFEDLRMRWHYSLLVEQLPRMEMAFELPSLADIGMMYSRFVVIADEPEDWYISLVGTYGAAILVGKPRMEETTRGGLRYWYKIMMREREQYAFAICRSCYRTIELFPVFVEASAQFVDGNNVEHSYKYSNGEGWGYCRCNPGYDRFPRYEDPIFFEAAKAAMYAF